MNFVTEVCEILTDLESCAKDINFDELNNPMWTKFECEE
jgi:hypothetical protein